MAPGTRRAAASRPRSRQARAPRPGRGSGGRRTGAPTPELTLHAREEAYRAYRAEGDRAGAGRVAAWLAADYLEFRGEDAIARGWLERAHRMLDGLPEGADHGWLALHEGSSLSA